MPGMLPGMQGLTTITHFCLAAALHALPAGEVAMLAARHGSGAPAQGSGALVVGTVKVPLLGASTHPEGGRP